ncbi:hypothetical protein ULMA_02500 [Patiriisocius marinus]|uniref:Helicase/UvrB N-terminal domain-containing protein n=1 Tax=Patiriisocius marinus TaxID=1397112 RepID=A0A5J4IV82_9FLAO|nr:DEAD/DEAH box helicase family protein [Patiriisocius marinus]GER58142.1 hypothetical protein ULMA_02500 [Patiriisocius marinus]
MTPKIIESDIIYKKIPANDFDIGFNVKSKEILPDENGFVSKQVSNHFIDNKDNFNKSETVLLNFGVGQGKSTTLNSLVNSYLSENYLAIILVPFKSLIDKYYNEFDNLGDNRFNYRMFEEEDFSSADIKLSVMKDLHILSVNAFLRNPGDNYVAQSYLKQEFLNSLYKRCKEENKKVVLFIDEIHASIHNFQRDKIFHLLKWSDVIHKSFIASATFTETSIQVSKYISLLTQKNILILRGERFKSKQRRAEVKLLLSNISYFANNISSLDKLIPIIKNGLEQGEKVNILSYSKNLANKIWKDYKEFYNDFNVELKLCTSETNYEFNEEHQAHVGTNFSTGVNINGGIFIILLPPHNMIEGLGSYGVFTGGYIALIQSIARMRIKGVIYICSSIPTKLIEGDYLENIKPFSSEYTTIKNYNLSQQAYFIKDYYNKLKEEHKKPIEFINSIKDSSEKIRNYEYLHHLGIELNYPTYEEFLLKHGDKLLYTKHYSYGKKILPYLFWALFNDQFQNAKLTEVIVEECKDLEFNDDNIIDVIYQTLSAEYNAASPFGNTLSGLVLHNTENEILLEFQNVLSSYVLKLNGKKISSKNIKLTRVLLSIIACKLMGNITYLDRNYFNDCIQFSEESKVQGTLINLYREFGRLKNLFVEFTENRKKEIDGDFYIATTLNNKSVLPKPIYTLAKTLILNLNKEDVFVKKRVFGLLRGKNNPSEKQVFSKLCDLFLCVDANVDSQKRINNKRYSKYLGVFNSEYPMNLQFNETRDPRDFIETAIFNEMFEVPVDIPSEILKDNIDDFNYDSEIEELGFNPNELDKR